MSSVAEDKIFTKQQKEAIEHGDGPLLIIAGAGTGKTTVITQRMKHLILNRAISPGNILALTFTEKAAAEMEERIDIALPYGYTQMWIKTFHGFCDDILRNEGIHIGLNPGFKLLTEAESILFLKQNLFKLSLTYFRPLGNPYKFLQGLLQHFSRLKDEDINPQEYLAYAKKRSEESVMDEETSLENQKIMELAKSYDIYERLKIEEGIMDFADLISATLRLFRSRKNILSEYQKRFHYILIDEFQDTNFAQNQLAILLSGARQNITVVGDDDQAIYRWRGAAISNMLQFKSHFPQVKIVTLTNNYRSTANILDAAYKLIQYNNPDRLEIKEHIDKHLQANRHTEGLPIELLLADTVENEAERVVKKIRDLARKSHQYKDFAILVRANDHAQPFIRELERSRIPYQFLGPGQLFHQEEIKDLIAYLKVLYNFEDTQSLYRVISMPLWNISAISIATLINFSKRKNLTLFETLSYLDEIILPQETKDTLDAFRSMLHRHFERIKKDTAGQILYYFLRDSGMLKRFLEVKTQFDDLRAQNIARFFDKIKSYEAQHENASVFAVVDWIDLSMQVGESPLATNADWSESNAVNILTIHSSKGLEFPVVFLVNLVTQRFPSRERRDQIPIPQDVIKELLPEGDYHLQEERRLFYVGMTRAKDNLLFSAANFYNEGKRERKLSSFVVESLDPEAVEKARQLKTTQKQQLSLLDMFPDTKEQPPLSHTPKITYVSYSQLQTFEVCPLHYKLKYLLKIPTPPSAAQSFGTSVHGALREFYQRHLRGEVVPLTSLDDIIQGTWIAEGYTSKAHERESFLRAKQVIQSFLSSTFTPTQLPVALETPFQFFVKNIRVGGRIDRVDNFPDGTIEIIDYKTGSNVPSEKDLAKNFQLSIYALAAVELRDPLIHRNPEQIKLSLVYVEEGKKLTTQRSHEELQAAKEEIMSRVEEITNSDFLCSGSILCATCEFNMLCNVH